MDVQPTNLQQLCDAIMSIWTKISEECFQHLVESISWRIKTVLKTKWVQPATSKVYLIKWTVSVYHNEINIYKYSFLWIICIYLLNVLYAIINEQLNNIFKPTTVQSVPDGQNSVIISLPDFVCVSFSSTWWCVWCTSCTLCCGSSGHPATGKTCWGSSSGLQESYSWAW